MHYPPETASVMLIAQMIATVLQVSTFTETAGFVYFACFLTGFIINTSIHVHVSLQASV